MAEPVVETVDLTRVFGAHVVVDHVSFTVGRGEIFGLIGSNGAGKSTLVKMLTTLLPPSSGMARVAGYDVAREPARVRAHIGYVPQLLSVDGALTARENLTLSAALYRIPRGERDARVRAALERMDLAGVADRVVQGYSGGMIRRLEIAQSMIHEPPVLFMDEPTVGLDPVARAAVWSHVRQLRDRLGTTILLTTHLMDEVDAFCERVGVLRAGRLERVGAPEELKRDVGPGATMEDVFARVAGGEAAAEGSISDVRQSRRGIQAHS